MEEPPIATGTEASTTDATATAFTSSPTTPTAIVHREYDVSNPPARPGPGWTRFVCISDTHSRIFPVPPGDVLLHGGDLTNVGTYEDFEITVRWLESLPHSKKIIIAGNHDITLHQQNGWYSSNFHRWHHMGKEDVREIRKLLFSETAKKSGLVYLEDQKYEFQAKDGGRTWSVWGSPWSPFFFGWGFNYHRGEEAERIVSTMEKTDILMTHGPPHRILDKTRTGEEAGCESLTARLPSLRPRLHVFGHIHEDHGAVIQDWTSHATQVTFDLSSSATALSTTSLEHTVFVNAANWPAGRRAFQPDGRRLPFGEGAFAPVIVDLLDEVPFAGTRLQDG